MSSNTLLHAGSPQQDTNITLPDANMQQMVDSMIKGAKTNGVACGVSVLRLKLSAERELLPVLYVYAINTSTNSVPGFLGLPQQAMFKITLLDAQDKEVQRTSAGTNYVDWSQKQIEDWFEQGLQSGRQSRFWLGAQSPTQLSGGLQVLEIFDVKKPGEYTLKLKMPLIQAKRDPEKKVYLETTWLPEVVGKIQILPEDIEAAQQYWSPKTNAPAK